MKKRLRNYRKPLVVTVTCFAFLATQLYLSGARANSVSQIAHITVHPTTTTFVQPLSPMGIAHVEAMSRFATLLTPLSDLPNNDWLLDDATAPELPVYLTDAAAASVAGNEGDGFFKIIAQVAASVALVAIAVAAVAIVVAASAVVVAAVPFVAATAPVGSALLLTAVSAPTAAAASTVATIAVAAATVKVAEVATLVAGATYTIDNFGYNPNTIRDELAKETRALMLSVELDG